MGRVEHERNLKIKYSQELIDNWNEQLPLFRSMMNVIGKPFGYSGMNVFYCFLIQLYNKTYGGYVYKPYEKNP